MTESFEKDLKRKLFADMNRIRLIEEAIADRYTEQEMRCPVHLSIGQEAVAVGVAAVLGKEDCLMSTHRAHAHYLAKGGSLKALIAELYGKKSGCTSGKGGSMHLVDLSVNMLGSTPIVGGSLPVAVGVAFAFWMDGLKKISAVFFGDGTTEEGVFSEALNFAALKKLPVLFVCENNFYSVYSPLSVRQPPERSALAIAQAHGMRGYRGNGNDVEEVYRLAKTAVTDIRERLGPVFLEFVTYRWREHCGPNYDNHIGYRNEKEFLHWKEKCPIRTYRERLLAENVMTEEGMIQLANRCKKEIEEAFQFAKESSLPSLEELFKNIYA